MSVDFGPVPANSVLPIYWTSHDAATGANETMSGLAVGDIVIYKGTSITQRSSTAGFALIDTDGIDVDTFTGVNAVSIDLSDNTDAGFYAVGSFYTVVLGPITIDAQTIYTVLATFRIVAAEAISGKPKVDVDAWLGTAAATPTVNGVPEVDLTHVAGSTTNVSALATNVDAILTDTGTTLQAEVDGIQADTEDIQARLPAALTANGNMKSSLMEILATVLTETSGLLAGGFKKFFNVATPTGTLNSIPDAVPDGVGGLPVTGTRLTSIPWNAAWDTEIESEATDALNAYDPPTRAELTTDINSILAVVGALADAAADGDPTATDTIVAYTKQLVNVLVGSAGVVTFPAAAAPANGVSLAEVLRSVYSNIGAPSDLGSGATIKDNLIDIEGQTDDIGAAGAGLTAVPWNAAWDAEVESEVDDALGAGTGTALTAIPWNASWDAEIQSEVQDALDAAVAEPTGVPAANASLAKKIGYLFAALRNKVTVTGTKKQFYDDAEAALWEKDLTDDGTTYAESEGNAP